ncbi:ATP-binding protein [Kocuria marina]|uniref:ATP-binding protein n=1 Tax=Kocuria marina TaxID=223184 RepID=UPI0022E14A1E|nr:ATP-binding protein [Kocuria marina]
MNATFQPPATTCAIGVLCNYSNTLLAHWIRKYPTNKIRPILSPPKEFIIYIRRARIINDGPIQDLVINLEESEERPRPVVLIGTNGSGKTNLLSLIADALFEGAASHFQDVSAPGQGFSRPWFRLVGGATIRRGTAGGFSLIQFVESESQFFYRSKSGNYPPESVPDNIHPEFKAHTNWDNQKPLKEFNIPEDQARSIYTSGVYVYFPASRSETPHWFNTESLPSGAFNPEAKIEGRLGKSFFIEHGIDELSRWIPSVMMDSRISAVPAVGNDGQSANWLITSINMAHQTSTLDLLNKVLQIVLDNPAATLAWPHRFDGLGYLPEGTGQPLPLSALSSGQATLFSIFGTLIQHCDKAAPNNPTAAPGVCLIDEVDAHIHIDLAHRAVPELITLFPKVQFFISAHSPLFVLGMNNIYGESGMHLIELPNGLSVSAESYSEFRKALNVLEITESFNNSVQKELSRATEPVILCEGETDPDYIRAAALALGEHHLLNGLRIDWIGSNSLQGGSRGAGQDNLKKARNLLVDNPQIASFPVMFLFDNDVKEEDKDQGNVFTRKCPSNPTNTVVEYGIENLLNADVFTDDMFETKKVDTKNGKRTTIETLKKRALCDHLCESSTLRSSTFEGFRPLLNIILNWRETINLEVAHSD